MASLEAPAYSGTNCGIPLDLGWVESSRVNMPAVIRRANSHMARRSIKKEWQAAWLLRVVTCIDLTTLDGDDTPSNINRLCFKARDPVRGDLIEAMGVEQLNIQVGAVCVYPSRVPDVVKAFSDMKLTRPIPIASVAAGFPAGMCCQTPLAQRLEEIKTAIEFGASEIDIVINRTLVLTGRWTELYAEVSDHIWKWNSS